MKNEAQIMEENYSIINIKLLTKVELFTILLVLFCFSSALGQSHTIEGKVTDKSTGKALPGVNILVKGTNTGTMTDKKGQYELSVSSLNDTLVVSYVGYSNKNVPIANRTNIDVQLKQKIFQGEEAVITAFGVEQKSQDVVGAVTSLDQQELNDLQTAPTSNLTTSLAGRIQGLIGFQRSGEPGANNAEFFVRGVTSFGYNKSPLILIDNIESSTDDLANLNPNDIASFSVLKDATATSLYGSRAANGVLLIKTKEGKKGEVKVDLRVENSISQPTTVPEFASPVTYMKETDKAIASRDPSVSLRYPQRKIDKTAAGANPYLYPSVNWRDMLFKDHTMNQRLALHVSGGGDVAQYYVSGSFDKSNGLLNVPTLSDFNNNISKANYSLRTNVNVNLTETSELKMKINGNFDDYQGPLQGGAEVYNQMVNANPVRFPAKFPVDSAHAYTEHPLFGGVQTSGGYGLNPYANMAQGYKHYNQANINAQFGLEQDLSMLTKGLQASALINVKRYAYTSNTRSFSPYYYHANAESPRSDAYTLNLLNPDEGTNYLSYSEGGDEVTSNLFAQAQATYNRTFGEKHGVSGLFVFTARNQTYDNVDNLQASLPHRNVNLASRLTYNYNHIYYIEGNFGYNASERFAQNHRWGFFPSVGLAWNISNEKFWEPIQSYVSRFKVRVTYGLSGNDAIGDKNHRFLYLSNVSLDDGAYGYTTGSSAGFGLPGVSISRYSNRAITWERAKKLNFGVKLGLFNHLNIKANFYRQDRTNILQERTYIPTSLGFSDNPQANVGEVKSGGFSTHVKYTANPNKNWMLQLRGNFTYAHNEYVQYNEPKYPNSPNKSHIGQPVGRHFGLIAERLFIDQADIEHSPDQKFGAYDAGDIKYRDVNGDGKINSLDEVPLGFPTTPEITYGFGFSAQFKGFDFSTFWQGLARESFWINPGETAPLVGGRQILKAFADDHWTESNQDLHALYPRFSADEVTVGRGNNQRESTWFMRDGSFLRLKEAQIGYSLPDRVIDKLSLRKLRIYVNGMNLAHFSPFKLWDPEMGGNGLGYPLQRTFNIGINAKF